MNLISKIKDKIKNREKAIIAIDGFGGSGKSTLAKTLLNNLNNSIIIEYDWFYLPQTKIVDNNHYDQDRLISEIISPFKDDCESASFHKYNWGYLSNKKDLLERECISFLSKDILIIEGCTLLTKKLENYFDFKIWVNTTIKESTKRGVNRDINEYGLNEEKVKEIWNKWNLWEEENMLVDNRKLRADYNYSF